MLNLIILGVGVFLTALLFLYLLYGSGENSKHVQLLYLSTGYISSILLYLIKL